MPLHTINSAFKDDSGSVPISGTVYIVDGEVNALILVPAGSVNLHKQLQWNHLKVHDYCFSLGTQTSAQQAAGTYSEATAGSILINFNSSSTPAPAMTVNAKQPQVFAPCIPGTASVFTADITDLYLNNAGASDLVLCVKVGLNS